MSHSVTNFEMQKYYQKEPKFNDDSPKVKDGTYVINLDDFKSIGTHRITLHVNDNNIICFDSFGVEHIPK